MGELWLWSVTLFVELESIVLFSIEFRRNLNTVKTRYNDPFFFFTKSKFVRNSFSL